MSKNVLNTEIFHFDNCLVKTLVVGESYFGVIGQQEDKFKQKNMSIRIDLECSKMYFK